MSLGNALNFIPCRRSRRNWYWLKPKDIARVILFLCTEDARVIHGAAIPVYGNG
jgi:NAD(P)-dependent dehydrogenase (short-subunit alcohol dehydrogenase family)